MNVYLIIFKNIFNLTFIINSLKFQMFSKIKSVFSNKNNPEEPQEKFKHPDMKDGDASQCPFMAKNKSNPEPNSNKTKKD